MSTGLLTEEEVRAYLGIDPPELERLIHRGKLTAFRVGGSFVRFRKEEVMAVRSGKKFTSPGQYERSLLDKVLDFAKFYGLYVVLGILVVIFILQFINV